jgi:hypothetical protein
MSTNNSWDDKPPKPLLDWGLERLAFPPPDAFKLMDDPPPRKQQGFFQEMLQGDPQKLLPYASARPDLHTVATILYALAAGSRSVADLHPEEQMQLDAATAEMLTEPPVKRKITQPFAHARRKAEEDDSSPTDAPPPVANAFWWV